MYVSSYSLYRLFFFFKQKTAYEMRISDWSSDVCSSDLFEVLRIFALGSAGAALVVDEDRNPLRRHRIAIDAADRRRAFGPVHHHHERALRILARRLNEYAVHLRAHAVEPGGRLAKGDRLPSFRSENRRDGKEGGKRCKLR